MLKIGQKDNFNETRIRDLIRARFDIKQGQVLTRHKVGSFEFSVTSTSL